MKIHHTPFINAVALALAVFVSQAAKAQHALQGTNQVFQPTIHSIEVNRDGMQPSPPVIGLQAGEMLDVSFDELHSVRKQYYFTVVHCDANWQQSSLWPNEYCVDEQEDQITDIRTSFNTRLPYIHYQFTFPSEHLAVKQSGNYLLRVYTYDAQGAKVPAIDYRIYVVDDAVAISGNAFRSNWADQFETHQEVNFSINTSALRITSPYQEIKVNVLQNWRYDNAWSDVKPFMVRNSELDYSYTDGRNQFEGGNEFRHFDTRSIRTQLDQVRRIRFDDSLYYVDLWEGNRRTFLSYLSYGDLNGGYIIKCDENEDAAINGEYAWVKFFLAYDAPVVDGDLYVCGNFNGWQMGPQNRMVYNYSRKGYELKILLKQGYYDYEYLYVQNGKTRAETEPAEGDHSETTNTYTVLVYYRQLGELFDKLVGYKNLGSGLQ